MRDSQNRDIWFLDFVIVSDPVNAPKRDINNKSRQLTLPFNVINGFVKLSPFAVERTFNKGKFLCNFKPFE